MATYMVICTFKEGTDMTEVFAHVPQERARVAELVSEGRLGSIHLSLERGTVFIETFADDEEGAGETVRSLPLSVWWDIDIFPTAAPLPAGGE